MESFRPVLMKTKVIIKVKNNINKENVLSLNNICHHVEHSDNITHFEVRCNGVITELIPIIHKILNISDHITFHTHIS